MIKEFTIKEDLGIITAEIIQTGCKVLCFSVYIWNIEQTIEIIKKLKEHDATYHIIVGGPEVSFESEYLMDEGVDAISIGEGEISLWKYIPMILKGEQKEVNGIFTKAFPNRLYQRTDLAYLEQFEDPYFLAMDAYDMDKRYFYFESSRGCPYGCEYCLSSTDRYVRLFSIEYVMKILQKVKKSNVKQVKFLDRTFNMAPNRALEVARYLNEECSQIVQFEIVAETLSDELLRFIVEEADKERFRFEVGVQSFYPKTLEVVGRIQNNEKLQKVIQTLRDHGVVMHVDLIAGLPYEDFEEFSNSFNTLFALHASELQLGILKLLKGTSLRRKQKEYDFSFDSYSPYTIQSTKWLSREELIRIEYVANAVEKYWNSGKCCGSIVAILDLKIFPHAFALFLALGDSLQSLHRPYQPHEFFQAFKDILKIDERIADGILLNDYYALFKQVPRKFSKPYVNDQERKAIFQILIVDGYASKEELYHYAKVDVCYEGELGYQVILYNKRHTFPRRWFLNQKLERIVEL